MTGTEQSRRAGIAGIVAALLAACVAFQLNASMLSPALVTMARELGTDETTAGLSQTIFFTLAAMFSLFLPRYSDIVGRRRILLVMLAVTLAGTVVAALAVSTPMLFVGRVAQGVCGPTVPICLIMLRHEIADPRRYGLALGILTAVNGGIAGVDALLGGWLAATYGFRAIFWVMAVVIAIAVGMVAVFARESRPSPDDRMDWPGVAALVVGVGALLLGLTEAAELAEANGRFVLGCAVVTVLAVVAVGLIERRSPHPLLPVAVVTDRRTWSLLLTTVLALTGVYAIANGLVVSLAQNPTIGFGLSADLAAVALLAPYAIVGWVVGPFAGRLAPRLGYRVVLRVGLAGTVVVCVLLGVVGVGSLPVLITLMVLLGAVFAGMTNILLNGLGVVLSPPETPGLLPGLNAGAFNLGAGLSFVVLPVAAQVAGGTDALPGYRVGMVVGAVVALLALAASFAIPRPITAESGP